MLYRKWRICVSFMDLQIETVRSAGYYGGQFEHLRTKFPFRERKVSNKTKRRVTNFGKEKRAVTRNGGFSGPLFVDLISLFPCVKLTLTHVPGLTVTPCIFSEWNPNVLLVHTTNNAWLQWVMAVLETHLHFQITTSVNYAWQTSVYHTFRSGIQTLCLAIYIIIISYSFERKPPSFLISM
jgi:hypothetical protein